MATRRASGPSAAQALARARRLDPVSLITLTLDGFQRYLARDHAAELLAYQRTVEMDPGHFLGHWGLGLALQNAGRFGEAVPASDVSFEPGRIERGVPAQSRTPTSPKLTPLRIARHAWLRPVKRPPGRTYWHLGGLQVTS